jgi:hypothetical protein
MTPAADSIARRVNNRPHDERGSEAMEVIPS